MSKYDDNKKRYNDFIENYKEILSDTTIPVSKRIKKTTYKTEQIPLHYIQNKCNELGWQHKPGSKLIKKIDDFKFNDRSGGRHKIIKWEQKNFDTILLNGFKYVLYPMFYTDDVMLMNGYMIGGGEKSIRGERNELRLIESEYFLFFNGEYRNMSKRQLVWETITDKKQTNKLLRSYKKFMEFALEVEGKDLFYQKFLDKTAETQYVKSEGRYRKVYPQYPINKKIIENILSHIFF